MQRTFCDLTGVEIPDPEAPRPLVIEKTVDGAYGPVTVRLTCEVARADGAPADMQADAFWALFKGFHLPTPNSHTRTKTTAPADAPKRGPFAPGQPTTTEPTA